VARIRSIKPELPSSKKLARASIEARYTLVLLITQADDEGFVLAEPRQLLGALYPHDDQVSSADLQRWIDELVAVNSLVVRETTEGARVLQLVGWHEHQAVKNPGKPKISPTLRPLSVESTETHPKTSGAEVRRFGGSEDGYSEVGDGRVEAGIGGVFVDEGQKAAYLAYRKAHRMPDGFDATLRSLHNPETGGVGYEWQVIGRALVEMRGASADFSAAIARGFCRRLLQAPPPAAPTDRDQFRREAIAEARRIQASLEVA
jgi:hypothetical protein